MLYRHHHSYMKNTEVGYLGHLGHLFCPAPGAICPLNAQYDGMSMFNMSMVWGSESPESDGYHTACTTVCVFLEVLQENRATLPATASCSQH